MKANLANISSRIQQEAEQACRAALVDWKKSVQVELQPVLDIFQGFLDQFNSSETDKNHLIKICNGFNLHEYHFFSKEIKNMLLFR